MDLPQDAQNFLPSHTGNYSIEATVPRLCQALAAAALQMEVVPWAGWRSPRLGLWVGTARAGLLQ